MAAGTRSRDLARFELLQVLSESQHRRLEHRIRLVRLRRGQRAYRAGDPGDQIFLLRSGVMKIAAVGIDGRERVLAFLYPGDIFGERAAFDDGPRDHFAEAFERAVAYAISRESLLELIQESPALGYELTKIIDVRLQMFRSRLEGLLQKSAPARLAQLLLDLAAQRGVGGAGSRPIALCLSQRDLGQLAGLSRKTVNRVLQEFRQRRLIEIGRRSIRLCQPDTLRAHLSQGSEQARQSS